MRGFLKGINVFTVIASILVPIVFICGSFVYQYAFFGENLIKLVIFLVYFLFSTVGYWGALIQGFRSIANGKSKTIISASVFQMIMYISHMLVDLVLMYYVRKSSDTTLSNFLKVFVFILILMIVLALVKMLIAKKYSDSETATEASPKTAGRLVLVFIVFPVVFTALVLFVYKFLESHPAVSRAIGLTVTIIIMLAVIGLVMFIIGRLPDFSSGSSSGGSYSAPKSKETRRPEKKKDDHSDELRRLKQERDTIARNLEACRKSNWDPLTCAGCGITNEETPLKRLAELDRRIKKLE